MQTLNKEWNRFDEKGLETFGRKFNSVNLEGEMGMMREGKEEVVKDAARKCAELD
jgi:hypothetical protein